MRFSRESLHDGTATRENGSLKVLGCIWLFMYASVEVSVVEELDGRILRSDPFHDKVLCTHTTETFDYFGQTAIV